jgi:hypothetical protein
MPVLHFSGKFKFQLAYFNNNPKNDARKEDAYDLQFDNKELKVKFDPDLTHEQVHERLLCDPTKYFEFEFSNVKVTKITYDDGSNTEGKDNNDPIIGKSVLLKGMLVDLAPHLQRGQLYGGQIRITDTLIGRIGKAIQSHVQKNIRVYGEETKNKLFHYSAYFETELYEVFKLVDPDITEKNSRFLRELKKLNLKIFFTLSRYDSSTNEGEAYGYIGPSLPLMTSQMLLIKNRKLLIDNSIFTSERYQDIVNDLKITHEGTYPRATFEVLEEESLLILRYIEIIPSIDYNNNIPNYQCFLIISNKKESVLKEGIILDCSYEEIKRTGGIIIIKLSADQKLDIGNLNFIIKIGKDKNSLLDLLIEPIWNITLNEDECIRMYSNETILLKGKVFYKNKQHVEKSELILDTKKDNESSPLVAWFEKEEIESNEGEFHAKIVSRNLENSDKIYDPVTEDDLDGDLPWDRYYGNELVVKFKNVEEKSSDLQLMVRVIHTFEENKAPTFEDIKNLFSYYMRYFPWIHVRIEDCNYLQFFNFSDGNDLKNRLTRFKKRMEIRLDLNDHDWYKMPRSRDFPKNGDIAIQKFLDNLRD